MPLHDGLALLCTHSIMVFVLDNLFDLRNLNLLRIKPHLRMNLVLRNTRWNNRLFPQRNDLIEALVVGLGYYLNGRRVRNQSFLKFVPGALDLALVAWVVVLFFPGLGYLLRLHEQLRF